MSKIVTFIPANEPVTESAQEFFTGVERAAGLITSAGQPGEQKINPAVAYLLSLGSEESRTVMRSTLNQVAKITGAASWDQVPWNEMRRNDVQAVMYQLAQTGLAPSTRNRYLSAMKGVANEAWQVGAMTGETFQRIKAIPSVKGTRLGNTGKLIKRADIDRLLGGNVQNANTLIAVRNRAIIALMLTSGLRKSEVCELKTKNIKLTDRSFTVIGKGDKEAKVLMQPSAIRHLNAWLAMKNRQTLHVFNPVNRGGRVADKALSKSGITHILRAAAELAEVEPFAPHDTRRTFATSLFAAGLDPLKVRDAMRHSSVETTQIYNIQNEEKLREAIESVDIIGA